MFYCGHVLFYSCDWPFFAGAGVGSGDAVTERGDSDGSEIVGAKGIEEAPPGVETLPQRRAVDGGVGILRNIDASSVPPLAVAASCAYMVFFPVTLHVATLLPAGTALYLIPEALRRNPTATKEQLAKLSGLADWLEPPTLPILQLVGVACIVAAALLISGGRRAAGPLALGHSLLASSAAFSAGGDLWPGSLTVSSRVVLVKDAVVGAHAAVAASCLVAAIQHRRSMKQALAPLENEADPRKVCRLSAPEDESASWSGF